MNIKRVEKYAEGLKGIHFDEWLELQLYLNKKFKEKMERFQAGLNLTLDDEVKSDD
jgi:hypothetical protein